MSEMRFSSVVRGIEVDVVINGFEMSPDINVFGGEEVIARDMLGKLVELSESEEEMLQVQAIGIASERCFDDDVI